MPVSATTGRVMAISGGAPAAASAPDDEVGLSTRKKIVVLMLFRVLLITLVLGTTVALNYAEPERLLTTRSIYLFVIIGATYVLTLVYGIALVGGRVRRLERFADLQIAVDLAMTTLLVHVTGDTESAYSWFYSASIIGAALVRGRRGALAIAAVSTILFAGLWALSRAGVLPQVGAGEAGTRPATLTALRQLLVSLAAFLAVGWLAAQLGAELSRAGERLEATRRVASNLAAQSADIIRCLSSGLITVDLSGRVTTWNQAAADITGITRAAAEGRRVRELLPALAPVLDQAGGGAAIRRAEIEIPAAGGPSTTQLGLSTSPLTDHRGHTIGHIVNFQDLTALRDMSAAVKRAEQLAVVGKLAASIAHEIRNPLAAISGSVELLEPPAATADPESKQLLAIVKREVDRMNGLVSQLLDYARPRSMVAASIDIALLVRETVLVFSQDKSFPGVTVALEAPETPIVVRADPEQMRQVVWNLLRNGAEAMPDGGTLGVSVVQRPHVDGDQSPERPAQAVLEVRDQGVGIGPDDIDRVFDPFFTTKRRGTGLGLATVYRIVTEHQGTIEVSSAPGQGATFTICLPLASALPPQ